MSIILAKIMGIYFFTIGLSFIINPKQFKRLESFIKNDAVMILGAIIAIFIGAMIVSLHNIWVWGWPVIITVLGWWSLIKGFGILAYPSFMEYFAFMFQRSDGFYRILGLFYAIIGAFLIYHGIQ